MRWILWSDTLHLAARALINHADKIVAENLYKGIKGHLNRLHNMAWAPAKEDKPKLWKSV